MNFVGVGGIRCYIRRTEGQKDQFRMVPCEGSHTPLGIFGPSAQVGAHQSCADNHKLSRCKQTTKRV